MDAEAYDAWYETPRGRWIGGREAALLRDLLQPRPGESLLDVGCGTGYFTRALAPALNGPMKGVDVNPEWVAYARRLDPAGASYEVSDARALPYEDDSFDLVVSVTALCFIAEDAAAVREMVRVARRRVVIGLLNRRSLLWLGKGRRGGSGGYRGARWHTPGEAMDLFRGLPVRNLRVCTGVHIPTGGWFARSVEKVWLPGLHTGGFLLVAADIA